jgi:hypothetical protein
VLPNPSLQPTCYGWLRQPPLALQPMFAAVRSAVAKRLEVLAEVVGLALSFSGASLAAVLGKLLVAGVLGAITLGFFLRLSSRRAGRVALPLPTPPWVRPVAAALSVVEVAVLVEAVYDPGFEYAHWVLALVAFVVAYVLQVRLLRSIRGKSRALESP